MKETWVLSLDWDDPLEEMATHSSILAREIPQKERRQTTIHGHKRGHNLAIKQQQQ